jgi:hypothetical protein
MYMEIYVYGNRIQILSLGANLEPANRADFGVSMCIWKSNSDFESSSNTYSIDNLLHSRQRTQYECFASTHLLLRMRNANVGVNISRRKKLP